MEYQIAIPSHKRAKTISQKTLLYLAEAGIPKELVRVFVEPEQVEAYQQSVDPGLYAEIIPSKLGVTANHNFITNFYPDQQLLVRADDDLRYLGRKVDEKTLEPIKDLNSWIEECFEIAQKVNSSIWGIYPVANPFFLKNKLTTGLAFLIGQFFGAINRHSENLLAPVKQDYERSILRFLADGTIARFDNVCGVSSGLTSYGSGIRGQAGGLQSLDRQSLNEQAVSYLLGAFPDFVQEKKAKKSGYREVRLVNGSGR